MPLYEYFCEACEGVFELLRPARESSKPQPCPQCDEDARRIVSKEWSAFIFRDGMPRRLPDTGGYWHLGKQVSQPLKGTIDGLRHPELSYEPRHRPPTVEEIEQFEFRQEVKRDLDLRNAAKMVNQDVERKDRFFKQRLKQTRGTDKEEQYKRRLIQKESREHQRHQEKLINEVGRKPYKRSSND